MRDALTMALQDYQGALVVVSHDRYLLRTIADSLVLVADGKVAAFDGDLDDYRDWLNQSQKLKQPDLPKNPSAAANNNSKLQNRQTAQQRRPLEKRLSEIERQLTRFHDEKTAVDVLLADPVSYQAENAARLKEGIAQRAKVMEQLQKIEEDWLEVSETLAVLSDV